MSVIIEKLPESLVLIVREYALDFDSRITLLLEKNSVSSLLRPLSTQALSSIFEQHIGACWDRHLYLQCYLKGVDVPTITSIVGGRGGGYEVDEFPHPICYRIPKIVFEKFPKQKGKQMNRFASLFEFLRYTSIFHKGFDDALRKQAYHLLAGLFILQKNRIQQQQEEKLQLQLQKNLIKLQTLLQRKLDKEEKVQNQKNRIK